MRVMIPTAVIGSGLQVAAVLNTSAPSGQSTALENPPFVSEDGGRADTEFKVVMESDREIEVTPPATVPISGEWKSHMQRAFKQLADKEAMGSATQDDLAQLESLTVLRRQSEVFRSGEEVVREYEQGQLIRNLLQSLTRYVEFEQKSGQVANSTRRRPEAKAQTA